MRANPRQPLAECMEGIDYRRLPYWPKHRWYGLASHAMKIVGWAPPPFFDPAYERFFAAWAGHQAAALQADVIHVHNFGQFVPTLRRRNPRARIVLHMHCEWLSQLPRETVAPWVQASDAVWGCSNHITELVQQRFPTAAARCHVIANGVDLQRFSFTPSARAPQILFVGRLSPEKGVHTLIEAFVQVAAVHPTARLMLVGPAAATPPEFLVDLDPSPRVQALRRFYRGDYVRHLHEMVPAHLRERVEFAGEVAPARLPQLYGRAAVLANPSLSESFGMSLVEAMASGVPVVAARTGGMPEIVEDRVTGRLVPPDDVEALAGALLEALADGLVNCVPAARARVEARFGWDRVAERVHEAYAQLGRT